MFGVIFYLFNVDLNDESKNVNSIYYNEKPGFTNLSGVHYQNENGIVLGQNYDNNFITKFMPGPPFVFGSLMVSLFRIFLMINILWFKNSSKVVVAILVAVFIKDDIPEASKNAIVGEMKSRDLFIFFIFF